MLLYKSSVLSHSLDADAADWLPEVGVVVPVRQGVWLTPATDAGVFPVTVAAKLVAAVPEVGSGWDSSAMSDLIQACCSWEKGGGGVSATPCSSMAIRARQSRVVVGTVGE